MLASRSAVLLIRLFGVYVAAVFGGSLFIVLNNLMIHRRTLRELLVFNVPFLFSSSALISFLLLIISYWRLYPVIRYYRQQVPQADSEAVFHRLMQFPMELFRGMLLISFLFTFLYHAVELASGERTITSGLGVLRLLDNVVSEMGIAFILSFLLLSASRRFLRSCTLQLGMKSIPGDKRQSAVRFIAISVMICFVITYVPASRMIVQMEPGQFRFAEFLLLSSIYALFAIGIFSIYIMELRQELRMLIDRVYALASGVKEGLHQTVPVLSTDEIGRLAEGLNALQRRVESAYDEVDQQLKLAYAVQNRLLPRTFPSIGGLEVAVSCEQCQQVGGDFYDLISLGEGRYCAAVGDVSGKGLPAALLMSAMMTGLRTEASRGGSAGEILTRLNRHVYQMTQGKLYSTLGLALLDVSSGSMELDYASAGHLDPYLVRDGQVIEWQLSSCPLGMFPEEEYSGTRHTIVPGDIFVLYTDGVIESGYETGSMLGFEWWEQQLRQLRQDRELEAILADLIGKLQTAEEEDSVDDRTIVLLRWDGAGMAQRGAADSSELVHSS